MPSVTINSVKIDGRPDQFDAIEPNISDLDQAMFSTFLSVRKQVRMQHFMGHAIIVLYAVVDDRPPAIWYLLAAQILIACWFEIWVWRMQKRPVDAAYAAGTSRTFMGLAFVEGLFWGLLMLPYIGTLGSDAISAFVFTSIVVTICLTCLINSAHRHWIAFYYIGFLFGMIPQLILYYDVVGPAPIIALLALLSIMSVLSQSVREQTRKIVCAQLEKELLSERLGSALAVSHTLARTDTLTGLLNRRAFGEESEILAAHDGADGCLAVILVDLDHFKEINDTFGHSVGDRVLKKTASCLIDIVDEASLIDSDDATIARWGGEEFIIIVRTMNILSATDIAEHMRIALIEARDPNWPNELLVTGSFGVAVWRSNTSLNEVINQADQAMYSAKLAGRNRTRSYHAGGCLPARILKSEAIAS